MREKGAAPLLIVVLLAIVLAVSGTFFYVSKQKKSALDATPAPIVSPFASASATLKEAYNNPFDEKTQYQNPFEESKNPFDNLQ